MYIFPFFLEKFDVPNFNSRLKFFLKMVFCFVGFFRSTWSQAAAAWLDIEFLSGLPSFTSVLCCLLCPKFSADVKIEFLVRTNKLLVFYIIGGYMALMNGFASQTYQKTAWEQKQQLCSENAPTHSSSLFDAIFLSFSNDLHCDANQKITFF